MKRRSRRRRKSRPSRRRLLFEPSSGGWTSQNEHKSTSRLFANDLGSILRVVERKTEDNWKWRDDHGQLLDEKSQKTWKSSIFHGELDTVLRDGPGEARHWSRTVELLPTGVTRFQDISRQYNNNYVLESIVRNY
ncbi:hypothetical protein ANCCAN_18445 [Ancylostoma caninum]|uniref:Uncharacterized protein n=1 Tax=Ancylostoma caninum TaxID=29170 RepID=A0A368FY47_ANCCA|nr:hypothetical protein ANCCAN_18445 [Ancylostoma caninum]